MTEPSARIYYVTQEQALAPGIVKEWPVVIPHPTDPRGRLKRLDSFPERLMTCAFCGQEYEAGTPTSGSEILANHISECEKHPMRELERKYRLVRKALVGLLSFDDPEMLGKLELTIRQSPAPAEDIAITVNAIQALLQTQEG